MSSQKAICPCPVPPLRQISPSVPVSAHSAVVPSDTKSVNPQNVIIVLKLVSVTASCWMFKGIVPTAAVLSFTIFIKFLAPVLAELDNKFISPDV